jgi:hypothetical protein
MVNIHFATSAENQQRWRPQIAQRTSALLAPSSTRITASVVQ